VGALNHLGALALSAKRAEKWRSNVAFQPFLCPVTLAATKG